MRLHLHQPPLSVSAARRDLRRPPLVVAVPSRLVAASLQQPHQCLNRVVAAAAAVAGVVVAAAAVVDVVGVVVD